MYITSPDPLKKLIEEFDFTFQNGMTLPISLDKTAGDEVDLDTYPHAILIKLAEKPSLVDSTKMLPAEKITIFTTHLLTIQQRTKEVEDITQEQKDIWKKTIQEISKTVQ